MELAAQLLTVLGIALMTYNVIRVGLYVRLQNDLLVGASSAWLARVVFGSIVVFDVAYVVILLQNLGRLSVGLILASGAAFVTVVIYWLISLDASMRQDTTRLVETLVAVIEARDPSLRGHSRQVRDVSLMIYDVLPRPQRRKVNREQLGYAALLHDLGKIGIPEAILNKPGPLTSEERAIVKAHPQIGVDIVRPIGLLDDATDWILYHHEYVDGTGYFGIAGDAIPLGARIISVADVFSALYMNRPYAGSIGYDECVRTMRDEAGTHLDPQIVEAFCSIPREDVLATAPDAAPAAASAAAPAPDPAPAPQAD